MTKTNTSGRGMGKNPVDVHIGQRLQELRKSKNMTLQEMAELLGVKYQQVQKYEKATNRLSMSRAFDICNLLGVKFDYFLHGMPDSVANVVPQNRKYV